MRRNPEILKVDENPWWSPTRTRIMERCKKEYWFEYVRHLDHKSPSLFVIGKHNHKICENMWKENPPGILVPGYKSYESCVNSSVRDWKFNYARTGESDGKKIEWGKYDGKGWGRSLIGRIAETAGIIYTRCMSEEPRLKSEIEIKVEFEGVRIMARLDELRKDLVIRDHKSGRQDIKEYFVKNNIQMTLGAICLFEALQKPYTIISDVYPEYRGINLKEFLDILTVEINDIFPRLRNGIHQPISEIYSAKRTEQDFHEAIQVLRAGKRTLEQRDFHPSKENCDFCVYRGECNKYNPEEYHEDEDERNFPLLSNAGLVLERYNPRVVKRRLQKTFRNFKPPQ